MHLLAQITWHALVASASGGKRCGFGSFLAGNLLATAVRKFDGFPQPPTYTWKGFLPERPCEGGWATDVFFHV